jgi:hypothetical protein
MRKILILACGALLFATSCLDNSGSPGVSSAQYEGSLVVKDTENNETTYSDSESKVTVVIPNILEPKFNIIFNNMKFDDAMPVKLDIEFDDIPFTTTISEDQTTLNYIFIAKDIVPTVGGVPYEKYTVDSIKGCVGRPVVIDFWMSSKEKSVHFTTATQQ